MVDQSWLRPGQCGYTLVARRSIEDTRTHTAPSEWLVGYTFGNEERCLRSPLPDWCELLVGWRVIPGARFLHAVKCNNHETRRRVTFKCGQPATANDKLTAIRLQCRRDLGAVLFREGLHVVNCFFGHQIGRRGALSAQSRCEDGANRATSPEGGCTKLISAASARCRRAGVPILSLTRRPRRRPRSRAPCRREGSRCAGHTGSRTPLPCRCRLAA